jgi:hypothetical protein
MAKFLRLSRYAIPAAMIIAASVAATSFAHANSQAATSDATSLAAAAPVPAQNAYRPLFSDRLNGKRHNLSTPSSQTAQACYRAPGTCCNAAGCWWGFWTWCGAMCY